MAVYLAAVPEYDLAKIREAVERGIKETGTDISGARTAVIKPNLVQARTPETGGVTHPVVVEAVVDALRERGVKEIAIAEASALGVDTREAFRAAGYTQLAKRKNLRLIDLFDGPRTTVSTGYGYENVPNVYDDADLPRYHSGRLSVPSVMLDSDLYINVAKMKTHNRTTVTLSLKNQWALLSFEDRKMYHRLGLHEPIAQLARAVQPHMTVVDGILGMEGNGPILGRPKQAGILLVGQSMAETDVVGSTLMGQDPREVIHLQRAVELGLSAWEVDVRGAYVEDLKSRFEPSPQVVKKSLNVYVWRNHRACHMDDQSFHRALSLVKRTPRYWICLPKLAYYALFGRIDIVRGRGNRVPELRKGQKIIVSGDCARDLLANFEELPKNIVHVPGCPPKPEDVVEAIIRM